LLHVNDVDRQLAVDFRVQGFSEVEQRNDAVHNDCSTGLNSDRRQYEILPMG